jgi:hypothetical protein
MLALYRAVEQLYVISELKLTMEIYYNTLSSKYN